MVNGPPRVPAEPASEAGPRDRARCDERSRAEEAAARVDTNAPELLAALDRQLDRDRRNDVLDERPVDAHGPRERALGDERERPAPPADPRSRVHALGLHDGDDAVPVEAPREERGEVAIALPSCRAPEDGRVDRQPGPARGADLTPAGGGGMPRLHADQSREAAEQVVPRVQDAPARDRVGALADDRADDRRVHRALGEAG